MIMTMANVRACGLEHPCCESGHTPKKKDKTITPATVRAGLHVRPAGRAGQHRHPHARGRRHARVRVAQPQQVCGSALHSLATHSTPWELRPKCSIECLQAVQGAHMTAKDWHCGPSNEIFHHPSDARGCVQGRKWIQAMEWIRWLHKDKASLWCSIKRMPC